METKILFTVIVFAIISAISGLPASVENRDDIPSNVVKKTVRYCQYMTPCAWKFYNYVDYPDIDLANDYCECRPTQKCQVHVIRAHEGYIEYRCKPWPQNQRQYD